MRSEPFAQKVLEQADIVRDQRFIWNVCAARARLTSFGHGATVVIWHLPGDHKNLLIIISPIDYAHDKAQLLGLSASTAPRDDGNLFVHNAVSWA